jgi:ankyrin repeat protein
MKATHAIMIALLVSPLLLTGMAPFDERLLEAAGKGDVNQAAALLNEGAQVNATNNSGRTSLYLAALGGHEAVARLLLEMGAAVNAADNSGSTPLHEAAGRGHEAVARLLLEMGAAVNAADNAGSTPLHEAAGQGHEALARLLLEKDAAVNITSEAGWTPLHVAARRGREAVARLLLDKGASVNATDKGGETPLHEAAGRGHEAVVRLLLEKGAAVNVTANDGTTPLGQATDKGHKAVVRLLVKKGARVDVKGRSGKTPFGVARGKAGGGTVTGTVIYTGKAEEKEFFFRNYPHATFCSKIATDGHKPDLVKGDKRILKMIEVGTAGSLHAVVVAVTDIEDTAWMVGYKGTDVTITFCEYRPFTGVVVNQQNFHVENTDADPDEPKSMKGVLHNAHSFEVKGISSMTIFNIGLHEKGPTLDNRVILRKEDRGSFVRLQCDQHEWEQAFFLPVRNPHYAVTGAAGRFTIKNVPAGKHKLIAWHPFAGKVEAEVDVQAGATVTANFQIKKSN